MVEISGTFITYAKNKKEAIPQLKKQMEEFKNKHDHFVEDTEEALLIGSIDNITDNFCKKMPG